eukprot:gene38475-65866_t
MACCHHHCGSRRKVWPPGFVDFDMVLTQAIAVQGT